MKKYILLLIAVISIQSTIHAQQTVSISGQVVEKVSQQPLEFATIAVLYRTDSSLVNGAITNELGNFELEVPRGTYSIRVEFIGFHTMMMEDVEVADDLILPAMNLEQDNEMLEEVTVTAERSTIEYKLDKRVFNVGKDIVSNGGVATDVLGNVPSVNVDASGAVSLRGNTAVRILINGKPSVLTANGGLESIPSENIEKIEVITNPSSKYDAEGTAGIINIVLKKNKRSGFSSSLNLTSGIPDDHSINYNVNYKTEKLNVFSNFRYSFREFKGGGNSLRRDFEEEALVSLLDQSTDTRRTRKVFNLYFGGDYYFNDKNTLTLSYYLRDNLSENFVDFRYEQIDSDQVIDSISEAREFYREPQVANQIELNHVKDFAKEGQRLTLNLQYDFWNDDENEYIDQQQIFPEFSEVSTLRSRDVESSDDFLIQSDLTLPLGEKQTIELGVKGEFRRIDSDYQVWQNDALVDSLDNLLEYHERIYGAYAQYGNRVHRLQYLIGVRAEYADTRSEDELDLFPTDKQYLDLFPTAHLTYKMMENADLQLSYSRRIRRPRFWQLNPFGGIADTRNIRIGNPDLNPMYTNSFELAGLRQWEKLTVNPSIYYQHTTNQFQNSIHRNSDGVLISRQINSGEQNVIGLEVVTSYSPNKWLRLSHELNLYSYEQKGIFQVRDDAWHTRLNANLKFSTVSAQASFDYRGARMNGQYDVHAQYWSNVGLSTDLLKDKASFSISVRNLLDSRDNREQVIGEDYAVDSDFVWSGRRLSATFTYRFNRAKNVRDRMPD